MFGLLLGDRVDSIDFWSARVRDLEQRITIAREAALENPPTTSFFVFFSSQKDAAIAAQTNLHAEDGHSFRVMEAPGPEEVQGPNLLLSAFCPSGQSLGFVHLEQLTLKSRPYLVSV